MLKCQFQLIITVSLIHSYIPKLLQDAELTTAPFSHAFSGNLEY